jgi:hypothetical protein
MVSVGEFSPDAAGPAVTLAKPKSRTFTVPSGLMLPGFSQDFHYGFLATVDYTSDRLRWNRGFHHFHRA